MSHDPDVLNRARSRIGTVLHGKYRIDRVLGAGGMAVVYGATHRNGKQFAIKMLHPELSSRRELRARFLREGYVANSVKHPGVVDVLDDDVADDGAAFLVMELLEGAGVEALCRGSTRRLGVPEALGVAHQLLDVLHAAHERRIVHRDVKPANLFLTSSGELKVLDFGIARLRDVTSTEDATRTGAMLGTPAFMAPEQALGEANNIDARSDVWSAGATLFTLLSGAVVHEGENGRQVLVRAATTRARSLAEVAPDVPEPVLELVSRALEFERDARWPSAAAMRDAVEHAHEKLFGPLTREPLRELVAAHAASRPATDLPTLDTSDHALDHGPSVTWKPVSTQRRPTASRGGRGMLVLGLLAATLLATVALLLWRGQPQAAVVAAPRSSAHEPSHAEAADERRTDEEPAPRPVREERAHTATAAPTTRAVRRSVPRRAPPAEATPSTRPAPPAPAASPPKSPLELELQ